MSDQSTSTTLTLTSGGITLLGVLLSVGVTVAFGINADWWIPRSRRSQHHRPVDLRRQVRNVCGPRPAGESRALDDRIRQR
jgi:hypothetical protein